MKKNILRILMFIFVPIIIIAIVYITINAYKKKKPGLYFKYKCNFKKDVNLFNGNLKAQSGVCNGLYIPFGVKLNDKDYVKVLEKMQELYSADNTLKKDMKKLAQMAVEQTV